MAMSDAGNTPGNSGPQLGGEVEEVQAVFPSDSSLQDAIARLGMAGFDRSDLSIPGTQPATTPEQGADNPTTEEDARQGRTLATSLASSAGALAAAGAVVATGGAALPAVAAAAAGGVGLGAAAQGVSNAAKSAEHSEREAAAQSGELVLSVRLRQADQQAKAERAMREAGATKVEAVVRSGVSSTGWTG
jgi:hypothetical protein